jgi:hypothetical protein
MGSAGYPIDGYRATGTSGRLSGAPPEALAEVSRGLRRGYTCRSFNRHYQQLIKKPLIKPSIRGIPKCFFGQVVLGGLGAKARSHAFQEPNVLFGHVAEGGKANNPFVSGECVVAWPWYPRPPTKHLATKPLWDPS